MLRRLMWGVLASGGLAAAASAQFTYDQSVEEFETLFAGNVINLNLNGTPTQPSGDATLYVTAFGDLDGGSEFISIVLDNGALNLGDFFVNNGNQYNSPIMESAIIPQATLASLAADGVISARVTPSNGVNDLQSGEFVRLRLVYDYVPAPGAAALLGLGAAASLRRRR